MKRSLRDLIILGVVVELVIFGASYAFSSSLEDTFRYAARYSGRLSAVVFFYAFYLFGSNATKPVAENQDLRHWLTVFAVLHVIHFGFLATNVYLNAIPLEGVKIAGGAMAYLMIVWAPFFLHRLKLPFQLVYFYYVSLVMILTWVARVKGEFQGADPSWVHYLGIVIFVGGGLLFGIWIRRARALRSS